MSGSGSPKSVLFWASPSIRFLFSVFCSSSFIQNFKDLKVSAVVSSKTKIAASDPL